MFVNKVLLEHSHLFVYMRATAAFVQPWQKWKAAEDTPGLKSLKHFLAGLLQKKFADPWDSRKIYVEERD